jgi:hypothetical protein
MASKKNSSFLNSLSCAIGFSSLVYTLIAILAIFRFGSSIQSNIMANINAEGKDVLSIIVRVSFLLVIACHIPFIFFSGKECFLNMYFELTKRAISKALEMKMNKYKTGSEDDEDEDIVTEGSVH